MRLWNKLLKILNVTYDEIVSSQKKGGGGILKPVQANVDKSQDRSFRKTWS